MFNFKWYLRDYPTIAQNGLKVFSTFACGGGSTMGYKLAGYEVVGANDIDPEMSKVYKENHHPKLFFECPIGELLEKELPEELYNLDILDGSPPCSTFSMAGGRDKNWKKKKKFKEGQATQVLSDLFFDWIKLVDKLKPKVAIAENVQGMLVGNAKAYTQTIIKELNKIGYNVQLFLLDASTMGVPQKRKRVFFICHKVGLAYPKLRLDFNKKPILFREVENKADKKLGKPLSDAYKDLWIYTPIGECFSKVHPKGSYFNTKKVDPDKVLATIIASSGAKVTHYEYPNEVSSETLALCGTFPVDYNYLDIDPKYLIGMSVPPVMIANIAKEVEKQWLLPQND